MSCPPTPAIGGITYYHPGDLETILDLGCTDLGQLNNATGSGHVSLPVSASVDDFDTEVTVQPSLADRLTASVGEPHTILVGTDTHFRLHHGDLAGLTRTASSS